MTLKYAVAFVLSSSFAVHAEGFVEGKELFEGYQAWQRVLTKTSEAQMDIFKSGVFLGYAISTADSFAGISQCFKTYAKQKKILRNDLGEIVGKYLVANPSELTEPAASLALRAFIISSKCTK